MNPFWNFLLEMGLFTFLGILYYFYQKRKIVNYEENKNPLIVDFILKSCLAEKQDGPQIELDTLIESLDDYLLNPASMPPIGILKVYAASSGCSLELREIILNGVNELEADDVKK